MRPMIKTMLASVATTLMLCLALILGSAAMAQAQTTPGTPAQNASFSPAQRAEIVDILRNALKQDPSILRDAVVALQADDARNEQASQAGQLAELSPMLTGNAADPVAGNPQGKVSIVEFYDVRCPYCRRMLPTLARLLNANPDLRLVYKDLPVLGPGSVIGAKALLAAQKQGGYQKLHDALMNGPSDVTEDLVHNQAAKLGLDWPKLQADMKGADIQDRINVNLALSRKLDLQGTPAYIVGSRIVPGAVDFEDLQAAVDAARKTATP